jgi:Transposase DDE domain
LPITACKKKLYDLNPKNEQRQTLLTQRTSLRQRREVCDGKSLQRRVRQLLADKISGNQVGIWLLLPEHLRLGTWDLLTSWTGAGAESVAPRLALQVVHEAALCHSNLRCGRTLSQKGFEVANGLPFVGSDQAIHDLLNAGTVAGAQALQVNLGKLRRASGHYEGRLLVLDPHRLKSYSKRQMRRHQSQGEARPSKKAQTFFCLDAESGQPIAMTAASGARTVAQATPELLELAGKVLSLSSAGGGRPLVLADQEHYSGEIFDQVHAQPFDLLVPMKTNPAHERRWRALPESAFQRHWAGYALARSPYLFGAHQCVELIQRCGENPADYQFKGFLSTRDRDDLQQVSADFPQRWHVEEFFKFNQALGWQRAGTLNLNVRYGQMTLALVAQAVIHQFRQRIGLPYRCWDAPHLGRSLFSALEGDVRVHDDTILVTYYNAPNAATLENHYAGLPEKLQAEGIDPHVPWLYGFKLDFRFK